MNLLSFANVIAAGLDWDYFWHWTHDQELGKVLISAVAPITTAVIAALSLILTAHRETRQMELSKQGTPPELTRYKEWLEVSEKYKKFVNCENVTAILDKSKEYQEIESSRKASLERAVWERKVFTSCPDKKVQKVLMQVNPSKIFRIVKSKNQETISETDVYVYPNMKIYLLCFILWSFLYFVSLIPIEGYLRNGDYGRIWHHLPNILLVFISFPLYCIDFPDSLSGVVGANYYFRKMIISHGHKFEINISSEMRSMSKRLRTSLFPSGGLDIIYCPWEDRNAVTAIFMKIVTYFIPTHYVRKGFKNKNSVLWGSYKEELLNGDLKKKLGREDTQAPNSDTPEESQPTPPQG